MADATFEVLVDDITTRRVDAVVNAANSTLLGGGGVDGAIHRAGGPAILEECRRARRDRYPDGLPTGEAVATTGGNLAARWVIHTVGPVWHGGTRGEPEALSRAVDSSFAVARELGAHSIAFPAISTGVYGFPRERAFPILTERIEAGIAEGGIERVELVLFSRDDLEVYRSVCR